MEPRSNGMLTAGGIRKSTDHSCSQESPRPPCRSSGELGGAKAQRRTVSMTSLVLGSALAWFPRGCSTNSVCRLPQVTGPLPYIRTVAVFTIRDHFCVRSISRACWYEDLHCLVSLEDQAKTVPAGERTDWRFNRKLSLMRGPI